MKKKVSILAGLVFVLVIEIGLLTSFKSNADDTNPILEEKEEFREDWCIQNQMPWMIYTNEDGSDAKSESMNCE